MATEAIDPSDLTLATEGRRPGVVDRIVLIVDSFPGPAIISWAAIGSGLALVGHVLVWASGIYPVGTISHDVIVPPFVFAWFGWLIHTLNVVANRAFDDFRPALDDLQSEDRYR